MCGDHAVPLSDASSAITSSMRTQVHIALALSNPTTCLLHFCPHPTSPSLVSAARSEACGGFGAYDEHRVDDARYVAQDSEQNADDQVRAAAVVHQNADGRQEDGEDDRQNAPAQHEHTQSKQDVGSAQTAQAERQHGSVVAGRGWRADQSPPAMPMAGEEREGRGGSERASERS